MQTVGLFLDTDQAYEGYTLWHPRYETSYLMNNEGKIVHQWDTAFQPGNTGYLLDSGNLVRTAKDGPAVPIRFTAGGFGGRVEEIGWDGTVIWSYLYSDDFVRQHHDIEPLPNGNVLLIAWELKTFAEAVQAGRDPALMSANEMWVTHFIEVQPVGASGGNIVWEWHVWDHVIQDFDPTKDNFGVVADHPELIDLNLHRDTGDAGDPNWLHVNAIDYNEGRLDQILFGSPRIHEIFVIDHSTTTAEAAGHTGGASGKGGDILYRWGNPQNYDRGVEADRELYGQHDPEWIQPGLPRAGNILVFNNGRGRPEGDYSTVDEFAPPVNGNGDYVLDPGQPYGPTSLVWTYVNDPPEDLFSAGLSSAQRLPNGNTLICEGRGTTTNDAANFLEVTDAGDVVWRYVNPVNNSGPVAQGTTPDVQHNSFRVTRYPLDFPGFDGEDLTPDGPLESFTDPIPTPGLTATRLTVGGDEIRVEWDASSCPSLGYNLIWGDLANVATHAIDGAECAIGTSGTHDWLGAPGGSRFFLIAGVDDTGAYESSWGTDSLSIERNGSSPSGQCSVNYKVTTATCP